jgi:hypothetical protein
MSCVLRVTSPKLNEHLALVSVAPYRNEKGCAHFSVSACGFDDFPGQLRDALAFLAANAADVAALMRAIGSSGVLDFAVEVRGEGFQFRAFPPTLVQQAAALGLGLELSLYPAESS